MHLFLLALGEDLKMSLKEKDSKKRTEAMVYTRGRESAANGPYAARIDSECGPRHNLVKCSLPHSGGSY